MCINSNKMKIVKYILILFAFIVSSTYGMTYSATDPVNSLDAAQTAIAGVSLAANQIAVPAVDGQSYVAVDCSDKATIKAALVKDHTLANLPQVRHGACCINAHHAVCQEIQNQIRANCPHTGKGDASESADANVCPQ